MKFIDEDIGLLGLQENGLTPNISLLKYDHSTSTEFAILQLKLALFSLTYFLVRIALNIQKQTE